jgi:hypothetical protein
MIWYQKMIEPGIRRHVRLLRDNGFNTITSCEHRMEITLDGYWRQADLDRLVTLLCSNGLNDFAILVRVECSDGHVRDNAVVQFGTDRERWRIARRHLSLVSWWWRCICACNGCMYDKRPCYGSLCAHRKREAKEREAKGKGK